MLASDPNENSVVYVLTSDNKNAVCGTSFLPMQINFFAENISDDSCGGFFDYMPGKEKDQVSPMLISEHQRKTNVCRFCSLITHIILL